MKGTEKIYPVLEGDKMRSGGQVGRLGAEDGEEEVRWEAQAEHKDWSPARPKSKVLTQRACSHAGRLLC